MLKNIKNVSAKYHQLRHDDLPGAAHAYEANAMFHNEMITWIASNPIRGNEEIVGFKLNKEMNWTSK